MIRAIVQYTKGRQTENPLFLLARAGNFKIEAPEGGLICHADGETITTEGRCLEVKLFPSAVIMRGVEQRLIGESKSSPSESAEEGGKE